MHIYLYDTFIGEKKYQSLLAKIETRITDLGLNGRIIRLGVMQSISNAIETEIKNGAKTIITIGGSDLFNRAINVLANLSRTNVAAKNIPLGFIPIGDNKIASFLGIASDVEACNTISARRIQRLDLGQANKSYFLTHATITTAQSTIEIDKNYSIEILEKGSIYIINLPIGLSLPKEIKSSAKDSTLELYIQTKSGKKYLPLNYSAKKTSLFSFKKLRIINSTYSVLIDQSLTLKPPLDITIAKEKINLIVGKGKRF